MKTILLFSMLAVATLMAPTAMAVALPDAGHCTDYSNLVQRVRCTVDETVEAIDPVIRPIVTLVEYEANWAKGVVLGVVSDTCNHVDPNLCAASTRISTTDGTPLLA